MSAQLRIRRGTARDIPTIISLIRELAKYERLASYIHLDAKRLRRHGFGRRRYFDSLVCTRAGRVIGHAVYYFAYSTFTCGPVLFVEDIFVLPGERGRGVGKTKMSSTNSAHSGPQGLRPDGMARSRLEYTVDPVLRAVGRAARQGVGAHAPHWRKASPPGPRPVNSISTERRTVYL